jgi:membrane protein HdeD
MSEQIKAGAVSGWSMGSGMLLIILGAVTISRALFLAMAVSGLISWLIVFAGCDYFMYAIKAKRAGHVMWAVLVGLAYIAVGTYMMTHPLIRLASLAVLLTALLFVEGILKVIGYFQTRPGRRSGWLLLDGIITLLLSDLIWSSSPPWAIESLVGASMILSGVAVVMMSLAARKQAGLWA